MSSNNTQASSGHRNEQTANVQNAMKDINREFKEREVHQKAREIGMPYIDLSIIPINDDLLRLVPEKESRKGSLIAFFQVGKKLRIAVTDPENEETKTIIQKLKDHSFILNINLCSTEGLIDAQKRYASIRKADNSVEDIQQQVLDEAQNIADEIKDMQALPEEFTHIKSDLALAILNRKAIAFNASDIHLEGQKNGVRVRGRIDGTLRIFFTLSHEIAKGIVRQIKFNANIASNEVNMPSDGQFSFPVEGRNIMVRVSILPGKKGESIVLRYLDPKKQEVDLEKLGFSELHKQEIETLLAYREGLIVTTGPTGSGKTTSLYAMLQTLNTPEKKIITLENPVEYELPGIIQSSIQVEKGYTFAEGLKSCLRQDPDIILLGEIRDSQTAETALQASMTGHLVLSTLHTNSAIDTLTRLRDLKTPNYLISNSLKGIIAQRLMRKPCNACSVEIAFSHEQETLLLAILVPYAKDKSVFDSMKKVFRQGKGCKKCGGTGYKGRSVVSEVLIVSREMSTMISENATKKQLLDFLHIQKHKFLAYDAAVKIIKGETDFNEAIRVLGKNFLPT